jgi:hypothetical protein
MLTGCQVARVRLGELNQLSTRRAGSEPQPGREPEMDAQGLFAGPFPLENTFGFRIGGLISHGFFRPYAVAFDFNGMRLLLKRQQ